MEFGFLCFLCCRRQFEIVSPDKVRGMVDLNGTAGRAYFAGFAPMNSSVAEWDVLPSFVKYEFICRTFA